MQQITSENKRIVINTVILYAKLIITIVVSFVTSRLVLQALGASDYGLYNVVGGIVSMLNILGTSMVATSYRYMAVELGKNEEGNPNRVYNTILFIHLVLALFLLLLGETIGVYYVNSHLNVAIEKIPDALFVLRLSLLTAAFAVITVPTNGLIIAREKFLFTSVVETLSALLKISLIVALVYMDGNKLRYYAIFLAICQLFIPLCYQVYCCLKDREVVKWNFNRNWQDYKCILSFAWWILLGASAVIGQVQGAAVIINHFFGTVLNAAFGLATQVHAAVGQFTSTLRQAFIPQIMKSQECNEERSLNLVYSISRYSFLVMNIMAIPLMLNMRELLYLWLGNPPEYTEIFINCLLINGMISNLRAGFDASIQATGKIRTNQLGYSLINLSLLPCMFIAYKIGLPPYFNVLIMMLLSVVTVVFQCWIMRKLTSFKYSEYIQGTVILAFYSMTFTFVPLLILDKLIPHTIIGTILNLVIGVLWAVLSIYLCGITKVERCKINSMVLGLINKRNIISE